MQAWICSCAENPLQLLFGSSPQADEATLESDSESSGYDPFKRQLRTEEQIEEVIRRWEPMLSPRIAEVWPRCSKEPGCRAALQIILKNTDARDDPVTHPYEHVCTLWYGDVGIDDNAAVLSLVSVEGEPPTLTYVVRLLAFMFADDTTFDLLQQNGGEGPLPMSCDNVRCVNIKHCLIPD